jgi:hypothetical protein
MSLASLGGAVTLDGSTGVQVKLQLRGTGLSPVATQWFEGAGDGAKFRGGRNLARVMDITLKVFSGDGRDAVRERLSLLGRIFSLASGDVRLTVDLDGDQWYLDVRRTGGGDFDWATDTDSTSYLKTVITVQAGSPFWTSVDEDSRRLEPGGLGLGLLGAGVSLVALTLSTSSGFGTVPFENHGDVPANAQWTVRAPFTAFEITSAAGETLIWGTAGNGVGGADKLTGFILVDMGLGTVVDELGANQYAGLGSVPRFWKIPQGESEATVTVDDAVGGTTLVEVLWRSQRLVMF